MLFLYRPQQTWMPFASPRSSTDQYAYNRQLQDKFDSTRRVARPSPAHNDNDPTPALKELAALRTAGLLTEAEFDAAKRRVLAP